MLIIKSSQEGMREGNEIPEFQFNQQSIFSDTSQFGAATCLTTGKLTQMLEAFFIFIFIFIGAIVSGNLFVCLQIWTAASLTYKQQKCVCKFFISKYFFSESDFCMIIPHLFNPISKMFCNFSLQLNLAKRRHVFLEL